MSNPITIDLFTYFPITSSFQNMWGAALNQLTSYLTINRRLSVHQSGRKRGTHRKPPLLILLTPSWKRMSKAFDSINHDILLAKLENVGVSSSCLSWFKSYLSERYQAARVNSTLSDKLPVVSDVPQGSILGSLLFSIYVNDLPSSVPQSRTSMTLNYFCSSISMAQVLHWLIRTKIWLAWETRALIICSYSTQTRQNWRFTEATKCSRSYLDSDSRYWVLGKYLTPAESVNDLAGAALTLFECGGGGGGEWSFADCCLVILPSH